MSPHTIKVLLHHHCSVGEWPLGNTPAYLGSIDWLLSNELVDRQDSLCRTTARGAALVAMLCQTPLPERAYVNPNTGKVVEDAR